MLSTMLSRRLVSIHLLGTSKRSVATAAAKKEGDISSVFVSLSGAAPKPLPPRFASIKTQLIAGHEEEVRDSWVRLLKALREETKVIEESGNAVIPQINYKDIDKPSEGFSRQHKDRGVALVRGVVSEDQAIQWKKDIQDYVRRNPHTKAFPADKPAVFELYWSSSQLQARAHPNLIKTQKFLMNHWHSDRENALVSTQHPVIYADRLRIRQPGDAGFALGPHIDGGSCERWEPEGYGRGGVYNSVYAGKWEDFEPFESSSRLPVVSDLYNGAGACSMFRMYQGWMAMSHTAPGEGTLLVNPLFRYATAYYLLRPFFSPKKEGSGAGFLHEDNWQLDPQQESVIQGASLGHTQELSDALHPHLDLPNTMVHVPTVRPGDYIVWHCDTIHAVDKVHAGSTDSSVMYIPTCPLTETNAEYLVRQREAFRAGYPGNDFPGGKGESEHVGRPTAEYLIQHSTIEGQRGMGLRPWDVEEGHSKGQRAVLRRANEILGFAQ
ncbi:hypothetical protein MMC30_008197 [Trapelia coarctata]|nr:hypothetical protein [Trapelia coarctata]